MTCSRLQPPPSRRALAPYLLGVLVGVIATAAPSVLASSECPLYDAEQWGIEPTDVVPDSAAEHWTDIIGLVATDDGRVRFGVTLDTAIGWEFDPVETP